MKETYFVEQHSIVRKIWSKPETILLIFAGASAEFALNKAVDWLYFTGRLPADPLGRLFSTVIYAKAIIFSNQSNALRVIDAMSAIHSGVEEKRKVKIPEWAYHDVLFMLIDYSIRSYEILERKLSYSEKEEVFNVFKRVGERMKLNNLPTTYEEWVAKRHGNLTLNLCFSKYTEDLFNQYKKHLGFIRYIVLLNTQKLILPATIGSLLGLKSNKIITSLISVYKVTKIVWLDRFIMKTILPPQYALSLNQLKN